MNKVESQTATCAEKERESTRRFPLPIVPDGVNEGRTTYAVWSICFCRASKACLTWSRWSSHLSTLADLTSLSRAFGLVVHYLQLVDLLLRRVLRVALLIGGFLLKYLDSVSRHL